MGIEILQIKFMGKRRTSAYDTDNVYMIKFRKDGRELWDEYVTCNALGEEEALDYLNRHYGSIDFLNNLADK